MLLGCYSGSFAEILRLHIKSFSPIRAVFQRWSRFKYPSPQLRFQVRIWQNSRSFSPVPSTKQFSVLYAKVCSVCGC